jgi:hypothetical protein
MCKRVMIPLAMALVAMALVISGCAGPQKQVEADVVAKSSSGNVRLFYGGSKEAKEVFCLNETLPVYRETWENYAVITYKEVGKVKITQLVGENYFDAEVVEGDVKDGDIVRKQGLGCLVRVPRGARMGY